MQTSCLTPSSPPKPVVWGWDFRSAVRLWKPMVAGCGRRQTYPTAPRFSSPCRRMLTAHHKVAPVSRPENGLPGGDFCSGSQAEIHALYDLCLLRTNPKADLATTPLEFCRRVCELTENK